MFQVRLQGILIFTEEEGEWGTEDGDCSPPSAGSGYLDLKIRISEGELHHLQ